jgi:hypothetical protein
VKPTFRSPFVLAHNLSSFKSEGAPLDAPSSTERKSEMGADTLTMVYTLERRRIGLLITHQAPLKNVRTSPRVGGDTPLLHEPTLTN